MKRISLLFVFLFFAGEIFSQDLEGEWKGYLSNNANRNNNKKIPISVTLVKLNDSTYLGNSKTISKKSSLDTAIATIEVSLQKGNMIMIEEKEIIKSFRLSAEDSALAFLIRPTTCLQKMKLKYKNKELSGSWSTSDIECGFGQIKLYKTK